jgi:hypothetical protein
MKRLLIVTLIAVLLSGCNRDDASHNDSFYMILRLEEADRNFSSQMVGYKDSITASLHKYVLHGESGTPDARESLTFSITNTGGAEITPGTYTDTDPNFHLEALYSDANLNQYEAGSDVAEVGEVQNHFELVISALSPDAIAGTFKGSFYKDGDATSGKVEITEGKFRMRISVR